MAVMKITDEDVLQRTSRVKKRMDLLLHNNPIKSGSEGGESVDCSGEDGDDPSPSSYAWLI